MAKHIELRKAIQTQLETAADRVYYRVAPQNATYPYIVFDLPTSYGEEPEIYTLDIDGWDNVTDPTALETLMDAVDKALHRKVLYTTDKVGVKFFRENRLTLDDDDARLKRRTYIYSARAFY